MARGPAWRSTSSLARPGARPAGNRAASLAAAPEAGLSPRLWVPGSADGGGVRAARIGWMGRGGGMPVRHAMLVITRAVFDVVEIPGQQPLVVARDTGDEAARRWWDEQVRAGRGRVRAHQRRPGNASWRTGRRRTGRGGQGTAARRRPPGGRGPDPLSRRHRDRGGPAERARLRHGGVPGPHAAADCRRPVRGVARDRPDRGAAHLGRLAVQRAPSRCRWTSACRAPSSATRSGRCSACLDRLAADGWQIVHVSEDRTGYLDGRAALPGRRDGGRTGHRHGPLPAQPTGVSRALYTFAVGPPGVQTRTSIRCALGPPPNLARNRPQPPYSEAG